MKLSYIDAHAHLNFDTFNEDREQVISEMKEARIGAINVGVDLQSSKESVELSNEHQNIWASVGVHPTSAEESFNAQEFSELILNENVVAVGECGLDYYRKENRTNEDKERQRKVFHSQIKLAIQHDLPLILHLRPKQGTMDAYKEGLDILEEYAREYGNKLRGTAHFFVGTEEIARRFIDLGFYISWTGVVTLTSEFDDVIEYTPLDRILVETDTPFAAPNPHRGQRNSPLYVPTIIEAIAKHKDASADEVRLGTIENTHKLFSLE